MWGYGPGWGWMGYGGWSWFGPVMMIIWFLFLVAVIVGIVWFARAMTQRAETPPSVGQRRSSLDVLEERYARGEINRDEYLQKRRDILGE